MNTVISRSIRGLSLALVISLGNAELASAATMSSASAESPIRYQTVGMINLPDGVLPGLVYYSGSYNGVYEGSGSIDLGSFVVSSAAYTTNATFNNTPFQIIASVGGDASESINGVLNGQVGPSAANPELTATITGITPYGNESLPFMLNLPQNTPMQLALPTSAGWFSETSLTGAVVAAAPIPEPASIAVFAVTLGGLGLWRRRRTAR